MRRNRRISAWLWTEWIVAFYNFVAVGLPPTVDKAQSALGLWEITERQIRAFHDIFADALLLHRSGGRTRAASGPRRYGDYQTS